MPEAELTMLGDACPKAIQALIDALGANKSAAFEGVVIDSKVPDHDVRKAAANDILSRKYGKPAQAITGDDGGPVQFQNMDLSQLSDAQFAALVALRDALKAGK